MNINNIKLDIKLYKILSKIFKPYRGVFLYDDEKRYIIFKYLCENISYDYDLLNSIKLNQIDYNKYPLKRNIHEEFMSVLDNKIGICNAIAQLYKLLLEKIGIYSVCVCMNDSTEIGHQLNLVYNLNYDCYSFDDVTSVIVKRGTIEDFYNYDFKKANELGQGNKDIVKGQRIIGLSTNYVYSIAGYKNRIKKETIEFERGGYGGTFGTKIPTNIESYPLYLENIKRVSLKR